jgi:hypothetical protein
MEPTLLKPEKNDAHSRGRTAAVWRAGSTPIMSQFEHPVA